MIKIQIFFSTTQFCPNVKVIKSICTHSLQRLSSISVSPFLRRPFVTCDFFETNLFISFEEFLDVKLNIGYFFIDAKERQWCDLNQKEFGLRKILICSVVLDISL